MCVNAYELPWRLIDQDRYVFLNNTYWSRFKPALVFTADMTCVELGIQQVVRISLNDSAF